jgi:hypothetical protein
VSTNDTTTAQRQCACGRPARMGRSDCEACRKRASRARRKAAQAALPAPVCILYSLLTKRLEGRFVVHSGDVTTLTTPSQMRLTVGPNDDGTWWWWRLYARANDSLASGSAEQRNAALNRVWEAHCLHLARAARDEDEHTGRRFDVREGPRVLHTWDAQSHEHEVARTPENSQALYYEQCGQHDSPAYEHDSYAVAHRFISPAMPIRMPSGNVYDGVRRALASLNGTPPSMLDTDGLPE